MAIAEMQSAIAANPNYAPGHYGLGFAYDFGAGRTEEGLPYYDTALRLSPYDPMRWLMLALKGSALRVVGRHDEAVVYPRQACQNPDAGFLPPINLAAVLAEAGQINEAQAVLARTLKIEPALSINFLRSHYIGMHERYANSLFDSLRKAGLPE